MTRSKSEAVPDGSVKKPSRHLSRREVLAAACLGALSALLSGDTSQPSVEQCQDHEKDSFQPVVVRLGVVALNAAGFEPGKSNEEIYEEVRVHTGRITHTTRDAYQFHITEFVCNTAPDSTRTKEDGTVEYYYSNDQIKKIAEEYREQLDVQDGEHSLMLMAVNTAGVENDVLGLAFQSTDEDKAKGGNGPIVLVLSNKTGGNVYSHEVGHVLSRDEKNSDPSKEKQFGKGMGHEMVMDCLITDAEGNITQYCAVDTIQQLLAMGCGLSKRDKSDAVNEYASPVTVMGNSMVYTDADTKVSQVTNEVTATEEHKPIYSPAELTFLDSRHQVECTTSTDGRYPLSYDFTKRFALAYSLPADHALKTILPKADTLIFAPIIEYIDKDTPFDSTDLDAVQRRIGVFATWDNGRGTALLDVSLFNEIDYDGEEENVIYADEQLGIVAVSGYDKKTKSEYVRIVSLSSQEGITLLDEARTRTAERNQLLLKPKQPNE